MSFNKKYLPDLSDLIKVRETYSSDEEFLDIYFRKTDAILGSRESFDYIHEMRKRVEKNEKKLGKRP
jgi:hypothetical protein